MTSKFDAFFRLLSEGPALTNDELGDELGAIIDTMRVETVRSFEEASVMTNDDGFVVTMDDGAEYQITIVQSKETQP